jgi:hypothetical protein
MPSDDPELAPSTENSYTSNTALLIPCVSTDDTHDTPSSTSPVLHIKCTRPPSDRPPHTVQIRQHHRPHPRSSNQNLPSQKHLRNRKRQQPHPPRQHRRSLPHLRRQPRLVSHRLQDRSPIRWLLRRQKLHKRPTHRRRLRSPAKLPHRQRSPQG